MPGIVALLYVIIAPTLMGMFVTVTLVVESLYNGVGIGAAAALGAVAALPVAWQVAKAIKGRGKLA
jgi:uncharacterized membrane protein YqjE